MALTTQYLNSNALFPLYSYGGVDKLKGNIGDLLRNAILQNDYFKTIKEMSFDEIVQEIV